MAKMKKIKLGACCNFVGCDSEDVAEVPADTPDEKLDQMAQDYMWERIVPEGWWEPAGEDDEVTY